MMLLERTSWKTIAMLGLDMVFLCQLHPLKLFSPWPCGLGNWGYEKPFFLMECVFPTMYNYFIGPHYCNHAADFLFKKKIPYIAFKDKKKTRSR